MNRVAHPDRPRRRRTAGALVADRLIQGWLKSRETGALLGRTVHVIREAQPHGDNRFGVSPSGKGGGLDAGYRTDYRYARSSQLPIAFAEPPASSIAAPL